jgi:hypothetical protein
VRAQTIFCPSTLPLTNGSCTNGQDGAFSGAALASQALTTKEVGKAIVERREQERRRPVREPVRRVPPEKPKPTAVERKEPPPPPALLPPPIEPAVRFGTWTQVYGDYQKRDADGPGILTCCITGNSIAAGLGALGGPPTVALNIESRTSTVGFVAGADFTSRALFSASDGFIGGVTAG